MSSITDALERLGGIATRQQLAEQLSISQASFSRLFQASRDSVIAFGKGRAVRYALRRRLARVATPVPVWRIGADCHVNVLGELEALSAGRFLFQGQVYDDLPWLFWDMRPQGYLGRGFAHRETDLGLPGDLRNWSSEDILVALTRRGEDCPGDLLLGQESLDRYFLASFNLSSEFTRNDYPSLIEGLMQGELPASSAGGEQPKFATTLADDTYVIVKFSPPVADSSSARRWGDLLVCEHLALNVLREHGQSSAESGLIEDGGRIMLETRRFDRTAVGRRALLSGSALDMEFAGVGENWSRLARILLREKRISAQDESTIRLWDSFGVLIGNSDRHLGNLSFFTEDYQQFTLAPAYDMLPMRWAPSAQGELVERKAELTASSLDPLTFPQAADMAEDFWGRVLNDGRLSGRMNSMAYSSLDAISQMRRQMAYLR